MAMLLMVLLWAVPIMSETVPQPAALTVRPPPMITDYISPECWNFTYGNWKKWEFYSPNYPGNYPNKTECVQYLEAPPGFKIRLDFRDMFDVEKSAGCKYDFLEVRDGPFGYSPLMRRLCGESFPPLMETSNNFMWLKFKSDGLLTNRGFRAVYSYVEKGESEDMPKDPCRIPVNAGAVDGLISSNNTPIRSDHPVGSAVDCTWEIHTEPGNGIRLNSLLLTLDSADSCKDNFIELYERDTSDRNRRKHHCSQEPIDFQSTFNRIFIRMYSRTLDLMPKFKFLLTPYVPKEGKCRRKEYSCGDMCISKKFLCNGYDNCVVGEDESDCPAEAAPSTKVEDSSIPIHTIILGCVGGVFVTVLIIAVYITCRYRKKDTNDHRHRGMSRQHSVESRVGIEVPAVNQTNAALALAKRNGSIPSTNYYSLSRSSRKVPNDGGQRSSQTSSIHPPSESESDKLSDPDYFKRFYVMDPCFDDVNNSCPSPKSPGTVVFVERHPAPQHMKENVFKISQPIKSEQYDNSYSPSIYPPTTGHNSYLTIQKNYNNSTPEKYKMAQYKYGNNVDLDYIGRSYDYPVA